MTTGSWDSGTSSDLHAHGFIAGKAWSGGDGRYTANAGQRQVQWNPYSMAHRHFRITSKVSRSSDWTYCQLYDSVDGDSYGPDSILAAECTLGFGDNIPASFPHMLFNDLWGVEDEYKVLAKLLNKVKSHSYNVGVALAEVDKLSSGIVSTIKQLGFGAADLASGRFSSFARRFGTYPPSKSVTRKLNTKDFSGRFLEMRYAWQPAVQDAFEAAKAFEALSNGPRKQVFRTSRHVSRDLAVDGNWTVSQWQLEAKRSYTYEAYEELGALRQMGLGNPASILWERLPYSFVIDWFLPIGTYLELIGQVPFLVGRFMKTSSYRRTFAGISEKKTQGTTTCRQAPPYSGEWFWVTREIPGSLDVPTPNLKVHGAVQGRRLQNALALSHQVFANAAAFVAGSPKLRKGRISFHDDGVNPNILLRLSRI
jgi:hypothetical protein